LSANPLLARKLKKQQKNNPFGKFLRFMNPSDEPIIDQPQAEFETPEQNQETQQESTDLNEELTNWKVKFEEANDKYLRLYSEFDNYRKRTAKEKADLFKTAGADIFSAILPVLDDFDRGFKFLDESNDLVAIREGQNLIHHKFKNLLISKGLEELDALGQEFDSDLHEAITSAPVEDPSMKGKVIDQVEKGYLMNGKVIRYAKVIVGA